MKKEKIEETKEEIIKNTWSGRKRTIFGLPLSFTKYILTEDTLTIQTGFFTTKEDDINLYRIRDITLVRNLRQKLFGIGTIHCISSDATLKDFDIKNVKNPKDVKLRLSSKVKNAIITYRASVRENVDVDDFDDADEM